MEHNRHQSLFLALASTCQGLKILLKLKLNSSETANNVVSAKLKFQTCVFKLFLFRYSCAKIWIIWDIDQRWMRKQGTITLIDENCRCNGFFVYCWPFLLNLKYYMWQQWTTDKQGCEVGSLLTAGTHQYITTRIVRRSGVVIQ